MAQGPLYGVVGLSALRRTLRQAGDDLSDLKDLNKTVADTVSGATGARVPTRSGALAATVRGAGTKTAAIVRAGKKAVPYANAVHWGRHYWPCASADPRYRSEIRPNTFLADTARATEPEWSDLYEQRINQILANVQGA
jgi:hypothetical protein